MLCHDGTMRVHTAMNVAMSISGFSFLEHQLLSFLVELGKYNSPAIRSNLQKQDFERICDHLSEHAGRLLDIH